jgi:hypothetical protein
MNKVIGKIRICTTSSCHILLYAPGTNTSQCPGCSSFGTKVKKVRFKMIVGK